MLVIIKHKMYLSFDNAGLQANGVFPNLALMIGLYTIVNSKLGGRGL